MVPGGFGERGVEGKILAIRYARENQIPFFGICLGMQLAVIEFLSRPLESHPLFFSFIAAAKKSKLKSSSESAVQRDPNVANVAQAKKARARQEKAL